MSEQTNTPEAARASAVAGELRVVIGRLKRRLRGEAHLGDLTWSQTSVLSRLEREGPAAVTTLARAEGCARSPWGPRSPSWRRRD